MLSSPPVSSPQCEPAEVTHSAQEFSTIRDFWNHNSKHGVGDIPHLHLEHDFKVRKKRTNKFQTVAGLEASRTHNALVDPDVSRSPRKSLLDSECSKSHTSLLDYEVSIRNNSLLDGDVVPRPARHGRPTRPTRPVKQAHQVTQKALQLHQNQESPQTQTSPIVVDQIVVPVPTKGKRASTQHQKDTPRTVPQESNATESVEPKCIPIEPRETSIIETTDAIKTSGEMERPNRSFINIATTTLFRECIAYPGDDNKHEILFRESITFPNVAKSPPCTGIDDESCPLSTTSLSSVSGSLSEKELDGQLEEDSKWIHQLLESKRQEFLEMRQQKLQELETEPQSTKMADATLRRNQVMRRLELEQLVSREKCPSAPPDVPTSSRTSSKGSNLPRSMSFSSNDSQNVSNTSSTRTHSPSELSTPHKSVTSPKAHARRFSVFTDSTISRSSSKANIFSADGAWSLANLWNKSSPLRKSAAIKNSSNKYVPCDVDKADIILCGQLQKRNVLKLWKKRWAVLTKNQLLCFKNDDSHKAKCIELRLSTFKSDQAALLFWIITTTTTHYFSVDSLQKLLEWSEKVQLICNGLMMDSIEHSETTSKGNEGNGVFREELKELLQEADNSMCADCGHPDPQWASISLGVFLCIECSGVHRGLGVSVSKVRSIELDVWEADWLQRMREVGNRRANEIWEAKLPVVKKLNDNCLPQQREEFIKRKYLDVELDVHSNSVRDVFIYFEGEEECMGFVEVDTNNSLASLRELMHSEGIMSSGWPLTFRFVFKQAPVMEKQESKKRVCDCLVLTAPDRPVIYLKIK